MGTRFDWNHLRLPNSLQSWLLLLGGWRDSHDKWKARGRVVGPRTLSPLSWHIHSLPPRHGTSTLCRPGLLYHDAMAQPLCSVPCLHHTNTILFCKEPQRIRRGVGVSGWGMSMSTHPMMGRAHGQAFNLRRRPRWLQDSISFPWSSDAFWTFKQGQTESASPNHWEDDKYKDDKYKKREDAGWKDRNPSRQPLRQVVQRRAVQSGLL